MNHRNAKTDQARTIPRNTIRATQLCMNSAPWLPAPSATPAGLRAPLRPREVLPPPRRQLPRCQTQSFGRRASFSAQSLLPFRSAVISVYITRLLGLFAPPHIPFLSLCVLSSCMHVITSASVLCSLSRFSCGSTPRYSVTLCCFVLFTVLCCVSKYFIFLSSRPKISFSNQKHETGLRKCRKCTIQCDVEVHIYSASFACMHSPRCEVRNIKGSKLIN